MLINELTKIENIKMINEGKQDSTIEGLYIGDLLSLVMGKGQENQLWLTVQTHMNVLAVANLIEMSGIVFVEGQKAEEATITKAKELGIPLFETELSAFELTKKLVLLGL